MIDIDNNINDNIVPDRRMEEFNSNDFYYLYLLFSSHFNEVYYNIGDEIYNDYYTMGGDLIIRKEEKNGKVKFYKFL